MQARRTFEGVVNHLKLLGVLRFCARSVGPFYSAAGHAKPPALICMWKLYKYRGWKGLRLTDFTAPDRAGSLHLSSHDSATVI